jgi:hypothetical protein
MKTTEDIMYEYVECNEGSLSLYDINSNQKWYSKEEIQEKINSLINLLEKKQKECFIYQLTTDELYCFVLDKLDRLKEKFGDEE